MSSLSVPEFSIRIVVCDHYMTKPLPGIDVLYSEFRGSDIKQVPVLRIFGPASDGHKACLHIHGVFPYFYVPCPTRNPEPQFLYQIAASLDKAINIALKQATSCNQHIYKISLVKGLPFYGFHDKDHLYLKIFLYNPGLIKQAVELCSNGTVLGQSFQPHESHLNFTLQFFIDFNLFGMSNIELQTLKFRRNSSTSRDSDVLPDSFIDCPLKPESVCYYEADCIASHIINRQRIGKGDGIENPGLEEVWNQEMERRKQLNISMASKSLSQGRLNATETDSHYKYNQMFHIKMSNLIDKPVEIDKNVQLANEIQYPAETVEGSILHKAVDVSVHQPDNTIMGSGERLSNYSTSEDLDSTLMNKSIALDNSAVHYSQIILDSDDMEFVDMLQDMEEEKCVENDSILGTPLDVDDQQEKESDDEEYSQIFHEETIVLDKSESKEDNEVSQSPNWNDSFWDGVNIPQLDGTCDDEHTKKVRKRKMKPLRVGLSRPVSKRNLKDEVKSEIKPEPETTNLCNDDIKIEEETELKDVSIPSDKVAPTQFCNENIKIEEESVLNVGSVIFEEDENNCNSQYENTSVTELVNMKEMQAEHTHVQTHFEPVAGPSFIKCNDIKSSLDVSLVSSSSPEDNNLGIKSFYNVSNMFNVSLDDSDEEIDTSNGSMNFKVSQGFEEESKSNDKIMYSPTGSLSFSKSVVLVPKINPPSKNDIISSLSTYKIPKIRHPQPYYSNHKDVGDKVEIGQTVLKIKSKLAQDQKAFDSILDTTTIEEWRQLLFLQNNLTNDSTYDANVLKTLLAGNKQCILEPIKKPPNAIEVKKWLESRKSIEEANVNKDDCKEITKNLDELDNSQAIGLEDSINNSISLDITDSKDKVVDESLQVTMQSDGSYLCFGNATSHNDTIDSSTIEVNFLTVMILEVHTAVRGDLCPDPTVDSIKAVFLTITNDSPPDHFLSKSITEVIVVNETSNIKRFERCVFNVPIVYVNTENEVMEKVIESIRRNNPDIMCGYEIEMNSWGYFIERALTLGLEIIQEMSRITEKHRQKRARSNESDFEGRIIGRVTFNVWRLFRYELALSSYSFENCMYEILKERVPKYSYAQLDAWWNDESRVLRWIPMEYYLTRLSGTIRMLEKLDIINRTSELARLFGLQWWEVLSRGSQFRVESLMLRAARPLNLIALSPTVKQRAAMKAPECLPLIFEPQSRFYADPMIVLDFQSLYPSMMIAYNYCFSTCIGRVQNINGQSSYEFGAWRLRISQSKLETLVKNGLVHWSPVGVGFVKAEVRRGVLPTLLRRILAARQAVKKSMKLQTDEAVKKAMHSRQLGLKLIANVTYGYTAANFSGRMPCVEVADSVVSKGRETLERAIKLVENSPQWNAKVVYGDTDSMFILVPGGTRAEAFQIGQEIADAVTADNPSPVALKLEKVYQPCILQTKKRYVGYMYESPDQEVPVYEAKGIETVRRDGCPAGVKLLQRCLCELFGSGDMSLVKRHVTEVLSRLVQGSLPVHELFFTREYNGPNGYRPGAAAPPAEIAKRLSTRDARALPRTGERVSWLVSAGAPSLPLVKLARTPAELDREPNLRPHVAYYVTRVLLPPLHRCLSLLGVNVFKWWNEIGYIREVSLQHHGGGGGIARYLWRERCALCSARSQRSICTDCTATPQRAASAVCVRWNTATSHVRLCGQICSTCCGHGHSSMCTNCECPEFWRRHTAQQKLNHVQDIIKQFPDGLICSQSFDF